ncbi:NAD(P)H-hydrate dehydratase [bacterium]|nr:NAD(P)H-hydrate dehydratase [bacterium]
MKVSMVSEMRALDRTAIEQYGIPDQLLMENAGIASFLVIAQKVGVQGRRFVVLCGLGNNGGDGFVVARKLFSNGGLVKVFILGDPARYQGAAKINLDIIRTMNMEIETIDQLASLGSDLVDCDVVVDAILGTGLDREIEGLYAKVINLVNDFHKRVISIDIASGINGNTGQVMGTAVRADWTVTFGLPKIGNVLYPGCLWGGELYVSHISFPPELYNHDRLKIEVNEPISLPERQIDGHKGSFGDVLFIAGASTYFGAPVFAALSFLKAGGGYARLATPRSMVPHLASLGSELVFVPQKETRGGSIALANREKLIELSERVDLVVLGPGLGLEQETGQLVREITAAVTKPLVIDGDGLTALGSEPGFLSLRSAPTVLTPHPGEMATLTGNSINEIKNNSIDCLQQACHKLGCMIVLKGAHSLIGMPDGRVFINLSGNSGMATAGSGDVLTGTIAAMYGLGLDCELAVRAGVFMHGLAGDLAALEIGQDGITARTIMEHLPQAVRSHRTGLPDCLENHYRIKIIN